MATTKTNVCIITWVAVLTLATAHVGCGVNKQDRRSEPTTSRSDSNHEDLSREVGPSSVTSSAQKMSLIDYAANDPQSSCYDPCRTADFYELELSGLRTNVADEQQFIDRKSVV